MNIQLESRLKTSGIFNKIANQKPAYALFFNRLQQTDGIVRQTLLLSLTLPIVTWHITEMTRLYRLCI